MQTSGNKFEWVRFWTQKYDTILQFESELSAHARHNTIQSLNSSHARHNTGPQSTDGFLYDVFSLICGWMLDISRIRIVCHFEGRKETAGWATRARARARERARSERHARRVCLALSHISRLSKRLYSWLNDSRSVVELNLGPAEANLQPACQFVFKNWSSIQQYLLCQGRLKARNNPPL